MHIWYSFVLYSVNLLWWTNIDTQANTELIIPCMCFAINAFEPEGSGRPLLSNHVKIYKTYYIVF